MPFFDDIENFFSTGFHKAEDAVTSVYHTIVDGAVRVYNDVSHDVDTVISSGADTLHTTTKTAQKIVTGVTSDVKVALDDSKQVITSISHDGDDLGKNIVTSSQKAITHIAKSGQMAISDTAKAIPATVDNLKWPLIGAAAVAAVLIYKK